MANKILLLHGTQHVWAAADFGDSPVTGTEGLTLENLAVGAAREGAKVDLGAKFARRHVVTMRIEWGDGDVPDAGGTVDLYWGASVSAAAGADNPGNLTGADADYAGAAGGSTLAQTLPQLRFLGSLIVTADDEPIVQQTTFLVELPLRYGIPVVVNNSSILLNDDDGIEMSIIFTPLEDEIQ